MMHAAKTPLISGSSVGWSPVCTFIDILGLTNVGVNEATTGTVHRLRFGTSDVKLIDPTHRPGAGPIGIDQQLGFRYLTFVVTNLDEVIRRLEAEHITLPGRKPLSRPGTTIAMVKIPMAILSNSSSAVHEYGIPQEPHHHLGRGSGRSVRRQRHASGRHARRSGQRRVVCDRAERCGHSAPAGTDPVHAR